LHEVLPVPGAELPADNAQAQTYEQARRYALLAFERRFLVALLKKHNGNMIEAAKGANVALGYLYRLKRRHQL
jgi:hypothetical protein